MNKPWKVILAFVGVFLAGVICGGALAPWWPRPERPPGGPRGGGARTVMERLEKQLDLTEVQKEKIRPIVERMQAETQKLRRESMREFTAAMERMNTAIAAELTPEQRRKLEDMRRRFRERAERFRKAFHEGNGGPPPPPPEEGGHPAGPPPEPGAT